MKHRQLILLLLIPLTALLFGCAKQIPESIFLKTSDTDRGIFFGRVAPLAGIEEGYVEFTKPGGGKLKLKMSADGYFLGKAKAGKWTLELVNYRHPDGVVEVTLASPYSFEVVGAQVTYIGVLIISPVSRNIYLSDDFHRDQKWFAERYGDKLTPQSAFANDLFYRLMEQYADITPAAASLSSGSERSRIEKTTFLMGDIWPGDGLIGPGDETDRSQIPPHEITVSGFVIDRLPVSSRAIGLPDDSPLEEVTWNEAQKICRNRGGRLPTEAEYELAARGPRWGDRYYVGAPKLTSGAVIGQGKTPSLLDQSGWVAGYQGVAFRADTLAEWTYDWYHPRSYATGDARDPSGPSRGSEKVVRAGPYRFAVAPDQRLDGVGFRCVYDGADVSAEAPEATARQKTDVEIIDAPPTASDTVPATPSVVTFVVVRQSPLLAGPNKDAAVVAMLPTGQTVTVAGETDGYYWVYLESGEEGFVARDRIEKRTGDHE